MIEFFDCYTEVKCRYRQFTLHLEIIHAFSSKKPFSKGSICVVHKHAELKVKLYVTPCPIAGMGNVGPEGPLSYRV